MSPVSWISDSSWTMLPPSEKALITASIDADVKKVRERGGNNRGPEVREYLRSVGLGEGFAWCAAFVTFHLRKAGATKFPPNPASACNWAYKSPYLTTNDVTKVRRGDLFTWCDESKWQGHVGFVVETKKVAGLWFIRTIEGNTGPDGGRDGDGVYRKTRKVTRDMIFVRVSAK